MFVFVIIDYYGIGNMHRELDFHTCDDKNNDEDMLGNYRWQETPVACPIYNRWHVSGVRYHEASRIKEE